jgi:hypothetical protein
LRLLRLLRLLVRRLTRNCSTLRKTKPTIIHSPDRRRSNSDAITPSTFRLVL